jgi:ribonuclease HI
VIPLALLQAFHPEAFETYEARPQKDEPRSSDSGRTETNYQSAKASQEDEPDDVSPIEESNDGWWHISFDGAGSKEGAGAGIWIRPPVGEPKFLSYKLHFKCTNNMVVYEALVLGLKALKYLLAQTIDIQGDLELIIKQV